MIGRSPLAGALSTALALTASSLGAQGTAPRAPAARPAMLASVDTTLLHGLRFRMVGPPRGGRVTTVTGVPSQPATFYMGVASGGVFRTTNSGASWQPITDGKVPVASTGSIAVSESDPNTIYLGTGSDDIRSNVSTGRGIYKSTDGGQTWSFVRSRRVLSIGHRSEHEAKRQPCCRGEHALGRRNKPEWTALD